MHKYQHRNVRTVKKQGNMTSPKVQNIPVTESKDTEVDEMLNK
jgi:hypothetical protein